jgi:anhydro-N-acetylmuramic acid kinase
VAIMRAIGLMSGTSLDGVDAALIDTDGERIEHFGPTFYRPYRDPERAILRRALTEAMPLTDRAVRPGILAEAERIVTLAHADAVERMIAESNIDREDIDVVGLHGQTVLHRPEKKLTVQIGDGQALATRLGMPVVHDFRAADVAAGGQGAPLAAIFHRALVGTIDRPHPVAVLNIGGVANVTFVGDGYEPIACDTGPGNALIDDFMLARTGAPYDDNGNTAAGGKPNQAFISRVMQNPFFSKKPPKSLDRNAFAFPNIALPEFSVADGAATLSALTVAGVVSIVPHLPQPPRAWIVAGGGAYNRTVMRMLAETLVPATVETADEAGWSADALEAQAFAFLAVRCLSDLPITFPTTSGAPKPLRGGVVSHP